MPSQGDNELVSLPMAVVQSRSVGRSEKYSMPLCTSKLLLMLMVLFAGSGCAALIYEVVWFQMFQLLIGSTAISLGVLLATFMGGLCLGSIILPHLIGPTIHPLRVWALLELGIGLLG